MIEKMKGGVLKGAACYRFSYSEGQKEIIHRSCEKLGLSVMVEEKAKEIYKNFLKSTLDTTIIPKHAIYGSIYIAAILCGEHRTQLVFKDALEVSEPTVSKWYRIISDTWDEMDADYFLMPHT